MVNDRSFLKPDRAGLARLREEESIRADYTGSLALIQDILSEFTDGGHPRFLDQADVVDRIREIATGSSLALSPADVDRSLVENIEQNEERARKLREAAESPRTFGDGAALNGEIADFLDSLLSTYRDVIQPGAGGLKRPRSARP